LSPQANSNSKNFYLESALEADERSFRRGEIIEAKVLDVIEQRVYIDLRAKSDGYVPLSEFTEIPHRGTQISVLIKSKESENDSDLLVCSKTEADARRGWETIKEAFNRNLQVSGRIETEEKGKGFLVNVEGVRMFLPASQLGIKFNSLEELKSQNFDFKIIKLNEKGRSGLISRRKLLEEINKEKWEELIAAVKVGEKVMATVTKIASFGVFCNLKGVEGLLRQNDISYKKFAPFKQYFQVGQEVEVLVLELNPENNRLSLGIKQMYEDPWVWAGRELEKDMVVRGLVTSLTNFGAFVELKEGLEGLIHSSELSWAKKPPHPKEVLKKGQEVDSVVLDIDLERKRLSLGLKQLLPNPWDNLSPLVKKGSIMEGKVTGITKYGAFVEVEAGIEGLIHIGDITWDEKTKDSIQTLKKGQVVKYVILDVNRETQRISCGLKQLTENPFETIKKKYPVGVIITGKIKSIVSFGIFVELEPGYEGLVHVSQIPDGKNIKLEDVYRAGETIKAVVLKIEPDTKKISLSIKDFDKALEKEEMSRYLKQDDSPSHGSLGSFINLQNK